MVLSNNVYSFEFDPVKFLNSKGHIYANMPLKNDIGIVRFIILLDYHSISWKLVNSDISTEGIEVFDIVLSHILETREVN